MHLSNKSFSKELWAPPHEVRPPYPFTLPWRVWYPHPLLRPLQATPHASHLSLTHFPFLFRNSHLIEFVGPPSFLAHVLPSSTNHFTLWSADSTHLPHSPRFPHVSSHASTLILTSPSHSRGNFLVFNLEGCFH
jgi:hypothetical protein